MYVVYTKILPLHPTHSSTCHQKTRVARWTYTSQPSLEMDGAQFANSCLTQSQSFRIQWRSICPSTKTFALKRGTSTSLLASKFHLCFALWEVMLEYECWCLVLEIGNFHDAKESFRVLQHSLDNVLGFCINGFLIVGNRPLGLGFQPCARAKGATAGPPKVCRSTRDWNPDKDEKVDALEGTPWPCDQDHEDSRQLADLPMACELVLLAQE